MNWHQKLNKKSFYNTIANEKKIKATQTLTPYKNISFLIENLILLLSDQTTIG